MAILGSSSLAGAGSLTTTVPVTMNLVESCSGFSAGTLDFGTIESSQASTASGTVNVNVSCADGVAWQITVQEDPAMYGYQCGRVVGGAAGLLTNGKDANDPGFATLYYSLTQSDGQYLGMSPACGNYTPQAGMGTGATQQLPLHAEILYSGEPGQYAGSFTLLLSF